MFHAFHNAIEHPTPASPINGVNKYIYASSVINNTTEKNMNIKIVIITLSTITYHYICGFFLSSAI